MNISWKKLSETTRKAGHRTIIDKIFEMPDGSTQEYNVIDSRYGVATVFALTKDGRVVIARQYRPGQERVLDELPGGMIDPGETPEEAIERELYEETGYKTASLQLLAKTPSGAYIDGACHYFLALDCEQATTTPENDEHEFIEATTLSIEEVLKNAYAGNMTDTVCVFFALEELRKRGIYKS